MPWPTICLWLLEWTDHKHEDRSLTWIDYMLPGRLFVCQSFLGKPFWLNTLHTSLQMPATQEEWSSHRDIRYLLKAIKQVHKKVKFALLCPLLSSKPHLVKLQLEGEHHLPPGLVEHASQRYHGQVLLHVLDAGHRILWLPLVQPFLMSCLGCPCLLHSLILSCFLHLLSRRFLGHLQHISSA